VTVKTSKMVKRVSLAAAGVVAAAVVVLGGSAIADAATPAPSASSSTAAGSDKGGSADTTVTGDELAKVTAAMTAKDSTVTVTGVREDPDGFYDVTGTKAGADVMYDVSADLTTFTQSTGRGGGKGRGGGWPDTAVTGDDLAKVTAPVKAKDSTITVTSVRKDPDNSYDVLGTKAGADVMYDVTLILRPSHRTPTPQVIIDTRSPVDVSAAPIGIARRGSVPDRLLRGWFEIFRVDLCVESVWRSFCGFAIDSDHSMA
jgi:hypothetical protein